MSNETLIKLMIWVWFVGVLVIVGLFALAKAQGRS